jgi:hypothetical protein
MKGKAGEGVAVGMQRLLQVVEQALAFHKERGIASPGEGLGYLRLAVERLGDTISVDEVNGIAILDALDRIEPVVRWAAIFYLTLEGFREDAEAKAKLAMQMEGEGEQNLSTVPEADPVPSV